MPAVPAPQHDKRGQTRKAPQRTRKAGEHRGELKFRRHARQHGDERVDGDVGKRVGEPRELLKILGAFWRWAMVIKRHYRFGFNRRRVHFFQPECQCQLQQNNSQRQIINARITESFNDGAADEKRTGIRPRPGDIINTHGIRHMIRRFAFADESFQYRPSEAHAQRHQAGGQNLTRG